MVPRKGGVGRMAIRVALSCAVAAGVVAATGSPASADSGARQISVHTRYSDWIRACGHNQNDKWVCTDRNTPNAWTRIPNWWWKGEVDIYGEDDTAGHGSATMYCMVRAS